jgi:hypothetical protein
MAIHDDCVVTKRVAGKKWEPKKIEQVPFLAGMPNYWSEWLLSLQAAAQYRDGHIEEPMANFEEVFQASLNDCVNALAMELEFEDNLSLDQSCDQILYDYMQFRVDASGALVMFDLAMLFRGVPSAHWQDKEWQRLRWLAGAIVAIDHDIINYHNDVSVDYVKLQMFAACFSETDALAATKQYRHNLIVEYNEIAENLYCRYTGDESITFWVDNAFPVWLRGGFLYQCEAQRHQLNSRDFDFKEICRELVSCLNDKNIVQYDALEMNARHEAMQNLVFDCIKKLPPHRCE